MRHISYFIIYSVLYSNTALACPSLPHVFDLEATGTSFEKLPIKITAQSYKPFVINVDGDNLTFDFDKLLWCINPKGTTQNICDKETLEKAPVTLDGKTLGLSDIINNSFFIFSAKKHPATEYSVDEVACTLSISDSPPNQQSKIDNCGKLRDANAPYLKITPRQSNEGSDSFLDIEQIDSRGKIKKTTFKTMGPNAPMVRSIDLEKGDLCSLKKISSTTEYEVNVDCHCSARNVSSGTTAAAPASSLKNTPAGKAK